MTRRTATGAVLGLWMLIEGVAAAGQGVAGSVATTDPPAPPAHPSTGPRDRAQEATGTGRISGRVLDGTTGRPLRGALVRLNAEGSEHPRTALADEAGRYEFTDLPAAHFTVGASKGAYVSAKGRLPTPWEHVDLARGQHKPHIDFRLVRGAVLAGRLTDVFGEPAAGIRVTALRQISVEGRKRLVPFGAGDLTDDLGRFRLFGLPAGEYFVSTQTEPMGGFGFGNEDHTSGLLRTYYPGTPSISDAETVRVRTGEEVASLTFALAPSRAVQISGTVVDSRGQPLTEGFLMLESSSVFGIGAGSPIDSAGRFRVDNLSPGDYVIHVNQGEESRESAAYPLAIGLDDITDLSIVTSPPTVLSGQVLFETAPPDSVNPGQFSFQFTPRDGSLIGGTMAQLAEDWTFEARLHGGRVTIQPAQLPPGWGLKAVLAGGVDVTDEGVSIQGQSRIDGIQLVLSALRASISGRVTDASRRPVTRGAVVIFADDPVRSGEGARRMFSTPITRNGDFAVKHVPAGEYLVVAVPEFEFEQMGDEDYLEALRETATPVTIGDGERRTVNLEVTNVD